MSLFTTNRENKYSTFSSGFFGKRPEEEENEEDNEKRWESFEGEKSDSEFSEKSMLQNKLRGGLMESAEGRDIDIGRKSEGEEGSRFFRTFNFPQGNNPFSLSQLLNNNPGAEERVKWEGLEETVGGNEQKANKGLFFGFGEEKTEEFKGNAGQVRGNEQSTESLIRKPPPGFKPNK